MSSSRSSAPPRPTVAQAAGRLGAWLTGIALYRALRPPGSRGTGEDAAARQLSGRRLLDSDSTDRIVQRIVLLEADARALLASIAELPTALRSVVELVAVDGLAVTEAAGRPEDQPGRRASPLPPVSRFKNPSAHQASEVTL